MRIANDSVFSIFQEFDRLPDPSIEHVTLPIYEVLQLVVVNSRVEDLLI